MKHISTLIIGIFFVLCHVAQTADFSDADAHNDKPADTKLQYRTLSIAKILNEVGNKIMISVEQAAEQAAICRQLKSAGKYQEAQDYQAQYEADKARNAIGYLREVADDRKYLKRQPLTDIAVLYTRLGCYYQLIPEATNDALFFLEQGAKLGNMQAKRKLAALDNSPLKMHVIQ